MLLRSAVVLWLAFAVVPQTAAGSVDVAELHRMLTAFFYAIGENRLEEAMSFYHEDSPQAPEARRELAFGQTAYLQRTSTPSLALLRHNGERAVVLATHRHLRIAGIKFMEERVDTCYVLRRQGNAWRLWTSVDQPRPGGSDTIVPGAVGPGSERGAAVIC